MAIVTLKDLMDPLSKIEAAAQQTNEKLDAIVAVAVGSSQNGVAIIDELQKQTMLLSELVRTNQEIDRQTGSGILQGTARFLMLRKLVNQFRAERKQKKGASTVTGGAGGAKSNASVLAALGIGSIKTAMGMTLWALVPKKGVNKFTDFIKTTFDKIAKTNPKKVKEGAEALNLMGGAISKFAKALALSAILIIPGMIAIPFLLTSIALVGGAISLLGSPKFNKRIIAGARSVDIMGTAIRKFAIGLGLFALIAPLAAITAPLMVASMLLIGGAVAILGSRKFSKGIRAGSTSLSKMGNALIKFTVGLAVLALATAVIATNPKLIPLMAGSIVLIGGAVAILGGKKISKQVRAGTKNLAILGLGISLFGLGYSVFAKVFPENIKLSEILLQAIAIGSIGLAVGLIGQFEVKTMAKGALALVIIGVALVPFALGVAFFSAVTKGMGFKDVLIQGATILAIGGAAALVGKFGIGNILMGAAALAVNGLGLMVFSLGYTPFAKATEGLGFGDILKQSALLVAIGAVMGIAGVAVAATAGAALLGPALFAAAGGALLLLAPGLEAMKNVDFKEKDAKDLGFTLGAVAMAFSGVDPEEGLFSNIGNVFTRVVQSGTGLAAAAMYGGAGLALQELSKGLATFKAIGFTLDDSKELALALGSVSAAFAQAGGEPASPGGLLGAFFGNTFSPNAVERGVDSVMNAGKALTNIAAGLKSFSGDIKPESVAKSIGTLLTSIGTAFSDLYTKNSEVSIQLKDFSTFIVTLGDVAQDGSLAKAATDIQSISNAINSIDAYKADSLGNLFKGAGELSNNNRAYRALSNAVEEIRDILGAQGDSIGNAINGAINGDSEQVSGGGAETTSNQGLNRSMNQINFTLSQLNSTMKQLPVAISALVDDTNP